ncbi:hypothetical protein [Thermoleptolyngbya sp.]
MRRVKLRSVLGEVGGLETGTTRLESSSREVKTLEGDRPIPRD